MKSLTDQRQTRKLWSSPLKQIFYPIGINTDGSWALLDDFSSLDFQNNEWEEIDAPGTENLDHFKLNSNMKLMKNNTINSENMRNNQKIKNIYNDENSNQGDVKINKRKYCDNKNFLQWKQILLSQIDC